MRPRYRFDGFCEKLGANAERVVATARPRMKKPIRQIVFWKDASETLIPQEVALFTSPSPRYQDADLVVALPRPRTSIPGHIDLAKEDGWSDVLGLHRLLFSRELHRALAAVAPGLRAERLLGDPDGFERLDAKPPARDPHVRRALAAAGVDASNVRALAERCFDDLRARAWLVGLAPKKSLRSSAGR